jgi:GT2 family glycosyltransferase
MDSPRNYHRGSSIPINTESKNQVATVVVCTYRRDEPLRNTLTQLIAQNCGYEILVIDQQANHDLDTANYLDEAASNGKLRYIKVEVAGLTMARNIGASEANGTILVFCDDDVVLGPDWVTNHLEAYGDPSVAAVAGQVLHPNESPVNCPGSFRHNNPLDDFTQIYGANFSIRRSVFQDVGGADENLGVHSYTEDVILARRLVERGYRIRYSPSASLLHLQWPRGGCRISDESQQTAEWEKSYSKLYLLSLSPMLTNREKVRLFWQALRHGPLRRNTVLRFWRQPIAWYGFVVAFLRARTAVRRQAFQSKPGYRVRSSDDESESAR